MALASEGQQTRTGARKPPSTPVPPVSLPPNAGKGAQGYRHTFGWGSDLEAFSRNPSDGSFAPLACRPST